MSWLSRCNKGILHLTVSTNILLYEFLSQVRSWTAGASRHGDCATWSICSGEQWNLLAYCKYYSVPVPKPVSKQVRSHTFIKILLNFKFLLIKFREKNIPRFLCKEYYNDFSLTSHNSIIPFSFRTIIDPNLTKDGKTSSSFSDGRG